MAFFPKLNINYIEIPLVSDLSILKKLIDFEIFDGKKQNNYVYTNLIFKEDGKRTRDFKYTDWWKQMGEYPTAMNAKTFSIIRNPYDRFTLIFHDFTKEKIEYKKYAPLAEDDINTIKNKFENFSEEYLRHKHIAGGVGLNIIELITQNFLNENEKTINADVLRDRYKYLGQYTILTPLFKKFHIKENSNHYYIYNESLDLKIHIIKKEKYKSKLHNLFPNIFERNQKIEDDKSLFLDIYNKKCIRHHYSSYYTKRSQRICQELFEQDFYCLHYDINKLNA